MVATRAGQRRRCSCHCTLGNLVEVLYVAIREQKTVATGEVHEMYGALRRQYRPPPGKRPEPLEEVSEPQAGIRRHTGVGFELVLNPVVPQMAEQLVEVFVACACCGVHLTRVRSVPSFFDRHQEEASSQWSASTCSAVHIPSRGRARWVRGRRWRLSRRRQSSKGVSFYFPFV